MAEPNENEFRGPINLKIKFRSASLDQFIERYAVDVSRGGIFIRTREPLAVGTRLKFDFQLLEAGPLLQGEGTVVWIREHDPVRATVTPGMGVRFDKLTPESQQTLDKILAEKDRMQEGGVAPGALTKSGAGIAVRRPTGAFVPLESAAPPPVPADAKPATPAEPPPLGAAPAAAFPAAQARSTGIFGRPRATTGMSALRSAPVPSALFEAPTADDIDKALQVLEDKPGPVPAMPPPPRLQGATASPGSPTPVRDDPSNEPTKVVDVAQEFAAHEAITGKGEILPEAGAVDATVDIVEDLTAKGVVEEVASEAKTGAMQQTAKIAAASLDKPLGAHLDGASAAAIPMMDAVESGRFRANATYRRRRPKTLVAGLATLVVAGGAAAAFYALKVKPQQSATVATTPAVASPPVAMPPPVPTPDPGPAPGETAPVVKEAAAPVAPSVPKEEPKPALAKTKDETAAKTKDAKDQKGEPKSATQQKEDKRSAVSPLGAAADGAKLKPAADRSGSKRSRRGADTTTAAATPTTPPEGAGAGGAAAETKPPAPEAAAANPTTPGTAPPSTPEPTPTPAPTPATVPPVLKITSSPGGAEVIVDGATVGTTPFSSKEIDPSAPHAITVRKDGFEAHERMISGSDWSKGRGGAQSLKINVKLRKTAGAEAAKEAADSVDKVEILTPDSP